MNVKRYAGFCLIVLICFSGHYSWAQAPASITGLTFDVTITTAGGGDTGSGSYTVAFSPSIATINYQGHIKTSSYTYSVVNSNTGKVVATAADGSGNINTIYFYFTNPNAGTYSSTSTSGSYENGTFTIVPSIVTGHIYCTCDGSPITDALVQIGTYSARSGSGGSYSISNVPSGSYTGTVSQANYYTTNISVTIPGSSTVTTNFYLRPNAQDVSKLLNIIGTGAVVGTTFPASPALNGLAIQATFTPRSGLTLSNAACLLGYDHFNWFQQVLVDPYAVPLYSCNIPPPPYIDPPHVHCDGSINQIPIEDGNGNYSYENADNLPFYFNEGSGFPGICNVTNQIINNGTTLTYYDQPSEPSLVGGQYLGFHTYLVGVYLDETYSYLTVSGCDFPWTSTYTGSSGGVHAHMSLVHNTNGIGNAALLQHQNLSPTLVAILMQRGGSFPVTIQPLTQTVVSGANVTFAISPTNSSTPLNYQWRINGTNILTATNLTLQLLAVSTNNAGNYDAVLSNSNGSLASAVATLTVLNAPLFQSPVVTSNSLVLSWATAQGKHYQLQYKTNLNQTTWINIGSTITASNTVLSATNAINSDKQRFYRVQQQ